MATHHHPNLLPLLCSFTSGDQLWMVEPYISNGSVLNIMKYRHPHGLSEELISIIVFETLKGLEYLHHNGMIHRDVKAGNILVDHDGRVYLADFGVSAPLERRGGSWGDKPRNTFVGTPCWMAPEVMQVRSRFYLIYPGKYKCILSFTTRLLLSPCHAFI
jgi:serine/threonine-protein kinase OSR1/STK39